MYLYKMKYIKRILLISVLSIPMLGGSWGFYGHKLIGEWSMYCLPEAMFNFYYYNKAYIIDSTVLPDVLKNAVPKEYCRHYIDLEHYESISHLVFNTDSCLQIDSCFDRGILPFIIKSEYNKLITAFKSRDSESILRQSGVLSHYCSDLCVPLHTTANYNGQLTGQIGVHALWESFLPEQHSNTYNLYEQSAKEEVRLEIRIMDELHRSHQQVPYLLKAHRECQNQLGDSSFGFFKRKEKIEEGYSQEFQNCFHSKISNQIEGQLKRSIQLTADLWYSAWILADKPNLDSLETPDFTQENGVKRAFIHEKFDKRAHE